MMDKCFLDIVLGLKYFGRIVVAADPVKLNNAHTRVSLRQER
jgi:hypothetical protein